MNRPRIRYDELELSRLTLLGCGVWWMFFRIGAAYGAGQSPLEALNTARLPCVVLIVATVLTRLHPLIGGCCLVLGGVSIILASPFLEFRLTGVIPYELIVLSLSFPPIFLGLMFCHAARGARQHAPPDNSRASQAAKEYNFAGRG